MSNEAHSDPLVETINAIVGDRKRRVEEYAAVRASDAYLGVIRQVDRGSPDIRPDASKPPTRLPMMTVSAKVAALDVLGRERFDQWSIA